MIIKILQNGGKFPDFHGTTALVQGKHYNIIFDTGFVQDRQQIIDALKERSLEPGDIQYVVNSHHHLDHCYNNDLFYHSKIVLHENEYQTINKMMNMPLDLDILMVRLQDEHHIPRSKARALANLFIQHHHVWRYMIQSKNRLTLVNQNHEIEPGIFIVPTPGHTSGHISLYIHNEEKHKKICLAGDAWISLKEPENHHTMPFFTFNHEEFELTRSAIKREKFHVIIPGHGKPFNPNYQQPVDNFALVI